MAAGSGNDLLLHVSSMQLQVDAAPRLTPRSLLRLPRRPVRHPIPVPYPLGRTRTTPTVELYELANRAKLRLDSFRSGVLQLYIDLMHDLLRIGLTVLFFAQVSESALYSKLTADA
jgi:hypothetical protein